MLKNLKDKCTRIIDGVITGVKYNAKITKTPIWCGWLMGMILLPLTLPFIVYASIFNKRLIRTIADDVNKEMKV